MGLLNNWLVKVTETITDILNFYVLQMTANKFAVYVKVYVVKKYLKHLQWLHSNGTEDFSMKRLS